MIKYPITLSKLEALIESEKPGWLARANERTAKFEQAGKYDENSSIWSEVKVVYMRLQGSSKCVFCERKLESEAFGKIEFDLEHFRPKGKLKAWPIPEELKSHNITFATVTENKGYFLLAYHPFNYAASCKPCKT